MRAIVCVPSSPVILRRVAIFLSERLGARHRLGRIAVTKLDLLLGIRLLALVYGFTADGCFGVRPIREFAPVFLRNSLRETVTPVSVGTFTPPRTGKSAIIELVIACVLGSICLHMHRNNLVVVTRFNLTSEARVSFPMRCLGRDAHAPPVMALLVGAIARTTQWATIALCFVGPAHRRQSHSCCIGGRLQLRGHFRKKNPRYRRGNLHVPLQRSQTPAPRRATRSDEQTGRWTSYGPCPFSVLSPPKLSGDAGRPITTLAGCFGPSRVFICDKPHSLDVHYWTFETRGICARATQPSAVFATGQVSTNKPRCCFRQTAESTVSTNIPRCCCHQTAERSVSTWRFRCCCRQTAERSVSTWRCRCCCRQTAASTVSTSRYRCCCRQMVSTWILRCFRNRRRSADPLRHCNQRIFSTRKRRSNC